MDKQLYIPFHPVPTSPSSRASSPVPFASGELAKPEEPALPITRWNVNVQSKPIDINVHADAIGHITKSLWEFQTYEQNAPLDPKLYYRYVFTNMTNEGTS